MTNESRTWLCIEGASGALPLYPRMEHTTGENMTETVAPGRSPCRPEHREDQALQRLSRPRAPAPKLTPFSRRIPFDAPFDACHWRTRVQIIAAFHQPPQRFDRVGPVTGTKQAFGALGGADGGRLPRRHHACARHVLAPIRHHGEAWATSAPGQRPAQRTVRGAQCRAAGIRGRVSRVLLWANLRSEACTRYRGLQQGTAAPIAPGDDRRDGTQD